MPLIVPGVCRFTVNQRLFDNVVANVLDMRIDTTGTITDRSDAIEDQATIILRQWRGDLLPFQIDNLGLESVSFVDLDSANGVTGTVSSDGLDVYPAYGANTGTALPGSVAALIKKNLQTSGRGRRAGRMYFGGLSESFSENESGNRLTAALVTGINTAMSDFLGNINQNNGSTVDYDSALCVVHVTSRDADKRPLTGVSDDVGQLSCDPLLATQRRRLRR